MTAPVAPSSDAAGRDGRPGTFQSISRTKITPPLLREETLTRGRLIEWLRRHVGQRLTLVTAEAGYGKTTLLADFGRHITTPVLWFKLDHTDRDWVTISNYLVAAFRELRPGFGGATMALLGQMAMADPPRNRILDTLLAEIGEVDDPVLLILDDFHLVDDSPDAREIVLRLLREAPPTLSLLIASRRRPDIELGRSFAQGTVDELLTDDLRFSRAETDELFADTYQQPLEPDVLDQLERRTEGWAASLQLFRSSIRGRSVLEIRAFARSLSGSQGPVYDFLAQEVLRELTPILRRFVVGAAILLRVVPEHIAAIFADDAEPPAVITARGWIEAADDLGLMGRRGESGRGYRFHPLLREFLLRQLAIDVPAEVIRQRHLRVAVAAEAADWLTACHHYLEADEPTEAVRVMGDSLLVAIGTGAWGVAAELLDRFPTEPDAPAVQVILALREIEENVASDAIARLDKVNLAEVPPPMRSLIRHALLRAVFTTGDLETARVVVAQIVTDPDGVPLVRRLARSFATLYLEPISDLGAVARGLERLGADCEREGFAYFAAISFHNALEAYRAAALYTEGYACGVRALDCFHRAGPRAGDDASTHACMAVCAGETGNWPLAEEHAAQALASELDPEGDARHEVASLRAAQGWKATEPPPARRLLVHAPRPRPVTSAIGALSEATVALSLGDHEGAAAALDSMPSSGSQRLLAPDLTGGRLTASLLLMRDECEAAASLVHGLKAQAHEMGATSEMLRLDVVGAVAEQNGTRLSEALDLAARRSQLTLLDTADAVVAGLHLLGSVPDCVTESIRQQPGRWRQAARTRISAVPTGSSTPAAQILELVGGLDDVPLLRALERTGGPSLRNRGFARRLAERASPPLQINDLGETTLAVGDRVLRASDMRRKAASLLMYLACRPRQSATRERVLEDLWPSLSPSAASNSLNQTLYFLRRDIDPWYEDGTSIDYVRHEAEVLTLPANLVHVASVQFQRSTQAALRDESTPSSALVELSAGYVGPFAPEFEYEEWSLDWRDHVHATYLDLVVSLERRLVRADDLTEAVAIARGALMVDPQNPDLHEILVWALSASQSRAAALEHYSRYAVVYREELGAEPPSLAQIAGGPLLQPVGTDRIRH